MSKKRIRGTKRRRDGQPELYERRGDGQYEWERPRIDTESMEHRDKMQKYYETQRLRDKDSERKR